MLMLLGGLLCPARISLKPLETVTLGIVTSVPFPLTVTVLSTGSTRQLPAGETPKVKPSDEHAVAGVPSSAALMVTAVVGGVTENTGSGYFISAGSWIMLSLTL